MSVDVAVPELAVTVDLNLKQAKEPSSVKIQLQQRLYNIQSFIKTPDHTAIYWGSMYQKNLQAKNSFCNFRYLGYPHA